MCAEQLAGSVPWAHGYRSVWSWVSSSSMNRALTVPPSLGYCELNELLHVEYLEHVMSPETVSCPSRGLIQLLLVLLPPLPTINTRAHTPPPPGRGAAIPPSHLPDRTKPLPELLEAGSEVPQKASAPMS